MSNNNTSLSESHEPREWEYRLEKIKLMQEAARIDIDRGNLLILNGQLRLQLLEAEEKALLQKIEWEKTKSRE